MSVLKQISRAYISFKLLHSSNYCNHDIIIAYFFFLFFFSFSFPQEHSSSALITLSLRLVGGKSTVDATSHQPPSHFQYSITVMNMVHNIQYHQRKKNILKRCTLVNVEGP